MDDALTSLFSPRLSPRPHQLMYAGVHRYALSVGKDLQVHSSYKKPGIFRRHSLSANKKRPNDTKRSLFGKNKAKSERQMGTTASLAVEIFQDVVKQMADFVTTFDKTDKIVFHLACMRRMYLDLHGIGLKLDEIVKLEGLQDSDNQEFSWEKQLQLDRETEENELSAKAAKNALPFTRSMMPHEPMEALTLLKFEIDFFKPGNSVKHVASMKKVFFSVVRSSNERVAKIPDWYIPPYAVNYSREKVMTGSVGTAHRGVWIDRKPPDGKKPEKNDEGGEQEPTKYDVVVKRLLIHADAIELFRQEVETWFNLDHPNILKLYGASHCSRPALLMLEDASNGPLVSYLTRLRELNADRRREKRKNRKQPYHNQRHALWSLFLEAAQVLKYLHETHKMVHGNLKSDNILVTADGHVKLADFGNGILALQNQAVQEENFHELGWRAPNCWQNKSLRRPSFQDDIYSFGLCVLDVLVPSLASIEKDRRPNGPKHVGDEGFDPLSSSVLELIYCESHRKLIEGMCKPKLEDRLSMKEVVSHMEEMRDAAENEPEDSSDCCIL